jgi:hypothetical protein
MEGRGRSVTLSSQRYYKLILLVNKLTREKMIKLRRW